MRFLLALVLVLPSLAFAEDIDLNQLSASNALGGVPIFQIIKNATNVTAQRVDSKKPATPDKQPELIILGEPFPVTADQAEELKKIFTTGTTYVAPSKACLFRANVRYGFATGDQKVELVLCFGCGEVEVWQDGKMVSFSPFDAAYEQLINVTKAIFPKDEFLSKFNIEVFRERVERMRNPKGTGAGTSR